VWAEYVKPYIDETFKRANIKDEPGIYKITDLETGKCYIGKSTNMKKRIADHFKSSIGIKTIAD
jgi:excinuclease UvrABC nuclease subunit